MTPYEMKQRIARLEELVESLYRQLELSQPPRRSDPLAPVWELVARKKKIQAIKMYREITGVGLREAKDAVEGHRPH